MGSMPSPLLGKETPNTRRRRPLAPVQSSIPEEGETTPKLPRKIHQHFSAGEEGGRGDSLIAAPSWPGLASCSDWSQAHPPLKFSIKPQAILNLAINSKLFIFKGSLIQPGVSAVVNAANKALKRGDGICAQIYQAAEGNSSQLRDYVSSRFKKGCTSGGAVVTPSFRLKESHGIPFIIHAVAPNYGELSVTRGAAGQAQAAVELDAVYTALLTQANRSGASSLTIPCLGTGIFRYPRFEAADIALRAIRRFLDNEPSSASVSLLLPPLFIGKEWTNVKMNSSSST